MARTAFDCLARHGEMSLLGVIFAASLFGGLEVCSAEDARSFREDSLAQVYIPPAPAAQNSSVPPTPYVDPPRAVSAQTTQVAEDWTITITPAPVSSGASPARSYDKIYGSIPFRRAEYLANPSYRHDSTMELMFGQLRPTVINRTDSPERVVNPRPALTQPYPISKGELYSYWPLLQYGTQLPLLSPIP